MKNKKSIISLGVIVIVAAVCAYIYSNNKKQESDALDREFKQIAEKSYEYIKAVEKDGYPDGNVRMIAASRTHRILYAFQFKNVNKDSLSYKMDGGLWISRDDGRTWKLSIVTRVVYSVITDDTRELVYFAGESGFYESKDFGISWQQSSSTIKDDHNPPTVVRLTLDDSTGNLYGRVVRNGFGVYERNFVNHDWRPIKSGWPKKFSASDVCFSPEDRRVYAINGLAGVISLAKRWPGGVYSAILTAKGYSWKKERGLKNKEGDVFNISIEPHTGTPYACARDGLYRKERKKWTRILDKKYVSLISFDAETKNRALLVSMGRPYILENGQWRIINDLPWHRDAWIHDALFYNKDLFVATSNGLWTRRDGGEKWELVVIGM